MDTKLIYTLVYFLIIGANVNSQNLSTNPSLLADSKKGELAEINFTQEYKTLGHNSQPWETTNYSGHGELWINNATFLMQDSLVNSRGKRYGAITDFQDSVLLYTDYGDKELMPITKKYYVKWLISTARYTPTILLQEFVNNETKIRVKKNRTNHEYALKIGVYDLKLIVSNSTQHIDEISFKSYDELYGDVITTFQYSDYKTQDQYAYPTAITILKINGKITELVQITDFNWVDSDINLLEKPNNYAFIQPKESTPPEFTVSKYNSFIHFIDLTHTDDKVMVVEFDEYLLVAEAPKNSANGELIINEAKKIAPNKPIRYFVFGHHHPHYLGGLRAFVHQKSTILCTEISENYVNYIAQAEHSLEPDNLQVHPKKIRTQTISDSLELGTNHKMIIYFIGEKSAHTKDYLIYYFPEEKMLFQDDLCWVPKEGPLKKSGARQSGLYKSILDLGIEVETIVQSWPVNSHKVKTIIPFSDLEKAETIKD